MPGLFDGIQSFTLPEFTALIWAGVQVKAYKFGPKPQVNQSFEAGSIGAHNDEPIEPVWVIPQAICGGYGRRESGE